MSVDVPSSWPVIDVDGVPGCVRYDEPAVFLGSPSESTCPARLIGRTTTVQLIRGSTSAAFAPTVAVASSGDLVVSTGEQVRAVVTVDATSPSEAASIAATVSVGSRAVGMTKSLANAGAELGGAAAGPPHEATTLAAPGTTAAPLATAAPPVTRATFSGLAFDTCTAPSVEAMRAWSGSNSPYGAVGIYIGGDSRGCAQPNLTPAWVTAVHSMGWHTLPLYVGPQAPCTKYRLTVSSTASAAAKQGLEAAADAVVQMKALGFAVGDPVYYDMESWDHKNSACSAAVMAFVDSWVKGLNSAGYLAGFYTSASTGMVALVNEVRSNPQFHSPDAIWFGRWTCQVTYDRNGFPNQANTDDSHIPADLWTNHARVKQFAGGTVLDPKSCQPVKDKNGKDVPYTETHGGVTIHIDRNYVDGPVTGVLVSLSPSSLPTAFPGQQYRADVLGSGGKPPYTFTVASGKLPAGLKLSSSGRISGVPTQGGVIPSVTIQVRDSAGHTAIRAYRMYVSFSDVGADHPFFPTITWLAKSGITFGYPDGTFKATAGVSRGAMAAFLFRQTHPNTGPADCTSAPFPDVQPGSKFCGHISWLESTGMAFGYPDGEFKPANMMTRGAMAAFLYRFTHPGKGAPDCTRKPFPDVQTTDLFCGHITWLKNSGITVGYPDGKFRASSTVTRGAMSAFLDRMSRR